MPMRPIRSVLSVSLHLAFWRAGMIPISRIAAYAFFSCMIAMILNVTVGRMMGASISGVLTELKAGC